MSVVDEIKSRLDLVEVVSSYVPLQKAGRNYKALCPFHAEKTPSFVVFPESQHWHCFGGCSEGGDVFTFVMKQEGWDFHTALEELARRAGVELQPRTPAQAQAEEEADRLRDLLDAAAQYYHHLLRHAPKAKAARAYIARRGLDEETVNRFTLGYSLPGWDSARGYLLEQGYTIDELTRAGLLVEREDGQSTYDRFRDRLMIPIRDAKGRVTGFGARTLDPEGVPKYLNSPQTDLFDKGRTLFGFDLARQSIRREDRAVIVEGYMDVMQAHQAGYTNVVAQMGTALTEAQLRQLQRCTKRLVLALDPDAAGVQATLRGVEVAREALEQEWEPVFDPRGLVGYEGRLGTTIQILRLPGGQDPDDLIREEPQRWASMVEEATSVVDFYLQILLEGLNLEDTKAKAHVVDTLLPVLQAVANPVERDDYIQKIARTLRVDPRAVQSRLQGSQRQARGSRSSAGSPQPEAAEENTGTRLEAYCMSALLTHPSILPQVDQALAERQLAPLSSQDLQNAGHRAIFEAWEPLMAAGETDLIESLRGQLPDGLHALLEELYSKQETRLSEEQRVRDIIKTLLRLRERNLKTLVQELTFLTQEAHEAGDIRAEQYDQVKLLYIQTLSRTQKALAHRWAWAGRG